MVKEQVTVLNALDVTKTQWYHFTAIVIAGMGFFTDAYDLFCISLVTKLLGRIYYTKEGAPTPGILPPNVSAAVNGVVFCSTLVGQLFFGLLGDKLGRKKVYGVTLLIMVFYSIASGLSFGHNPEGVMATLCFFRFWLDFGIGSNYPLSATIMSEYASKRTRDAFIAAVFAMQGFGILVGGIVTLIISSAFKHKYKAPPYSVNPKESLVPEANYIWRMILMFGAILAALTYYWRIKMPETVRYTALVVKNLNQATMDMSKVLQVDLNKITSQNDHKVIEKRSVDQQDQNLFQKDIFSKIGWIPPAKTMSVTGEIYKIARAQTLIALCGIVPGYWFTVFFIDILGQFTIQLMGFFVMTVFMFGLAIPYHHWTLPVNRIGFVVTYSLTFFFANFGPNATTFIVPVEIFPARLRSTCHGISTAAGKAGAIVRAFGFLYASQSNNPTERDPGYPAGVVPEPKGKSLEELSGENEDEDEVGGKAKAQSNSITTSRTVPL
ncbi:Major facilitator, sugar transporter-like [Parasponia andersonii]|uniref:Major facilitator, sugar transporter-like n=1 Tax=Parasponia andersonii TaxID=3476 RepID=A0A2P5BX40_PARAD|nr:Major facilitator, sugar transporter-like [Parasponia andersonii]